MPIEAVISDADGLHAAIMLIDMDMDMDMATTAGAVGYVGLARFGFADSREEFIGGRSDISPMRASADVSERCRIKG